MSEDSDQSYPDLKAIKDIALDIMAHVESDPKASTVLPRGIDDIYIKLSYGHATLEIEISSRCKKYPRQIVHASSRPG